MDSKKDIRKQAVILIHGIGEQHPMDTLRSFVNGIKNQLVKQDESERNTIIRSQPDGISNIYETRRLCLNASRKRPKTDFYEFYWAHNMRDNNFTHISSWLLKLIFSKPSKIPKTLIPVWWSVWLTLVLVTIATTCILSFVGVDKIKSLTSAIVVLPTIYGMIILFAKSFFLNTIGDAGRYFTPAPSNIGERYKIRQQGIEFLKKIHEKTNDEKYDRIIIVGHSLGSVIAYDLLRLLWTEFNESYDKVSIIDQSKISEIESYSNGKKEIKNVNIFQQQQYQCWLQQKTIGNKWLISDLITIGAPLCNADYLIVSNVSFDELKNQREFPVCPPTVDDRSGTMHFTKTYDIENGKRTIKILHHAALFAVTRWTNIYFSSDFIGGPMQRLFGKAVKDVKINRKSIWFYPGGHTNYWDINSEKSLRMIVNALQLRNDKSNHK